VWGEQTRRKGEKGGEERDRITISTRIPVYLLFIGDAEEMGRGSLERAQSYRKGKGKRRKGKKEGGEEEELRGAILDK